MELNTDYIKQVLLSLAFGLPRITAVFWTLPFLNKEIAPGYVKNGIIISLMIGLYPIFGSGAMESIPRFPTYLFIVLKEVFIGLLMGFLVGIIFWAVQSAGNQIDINNGSYSSVFGDQASQTQLTPYGKLLYQIAVVLFFVFGGFHSLISAISISYEVWPISTFFPSIKKELVLLVFGLADKILKIALLVAAPVVISTFTMELGLGFVTRMAPQMNVFVIAMPVKTGIGMVVIYLYLWYLVTFIREEFQETESILRVIQAVIS